MKKLIKFLLLIFTCVNIGFARADTETIQWYSDGELYTTTSCENGDDVILPPAPPIKPGFKFIGWRIADIPPLYTRLEYIEGTGTQYINTGVNANVPAAQLLSATIDFQASNMPNNDSWVFGGYPGNNDGNFIVGSFSGQTVALYGSLFYRTNKSFDTERHVVRINHADGSYWDDIKIGNAVYNTYHLDNILYLFASNHRRPTPLFLPAKVYACQIFIDGVLIRDFIPAMRNADSEIGMYDAVTQTFFTNQGGGVFVAGPVKI